MREIAIGGGENYAPSIVPHDSSHSPVIDFITGAVDGMLMPAKGNRLSDEENCVASQLIDQGAAWPDSASTQPSDKRDWWSLRPLVQPLVPHVAVAGSTN